MRVSFYLIGTLSFYAVAIAGAILIGSVTVIFDFVSAFAVSATSFVFPGLFYLTASKRFGGKTNYYTRMSYLFIGVGIFNCIIGLAATALEIIDSSGKAVE